MPQNTFGGRKATLAWTVPTKYVNPLRDHRHMASVSSLALMLGAAGIVATTLPASAADVTWTGAISTDWFDPGNWTPVAVPGATDYANLNTLTPNPTVISGANANGLVVFVGRNAGDVGSLAILNGGTLSDSQGYLGTFVGSTGTATVDGAGSSWNSIDDFYVSYQGVGTLTISNGGSVNNVNGFLGDYYDSLGTATVDGTGSTWTNSGGLTVGDWGHGELTVSNGGAVSNAVGYFGTGAYLGRREGSIGIATVTDAGSTWTSSGDLTVGDNGTGTLAITKGGAVSNDTAYVGKSVGSTGTATVDDATWTNNGALYVGHDGDGSLTIINGGTVSDSQGSVGRFAGSTGTVTVDGAGSAWLHSDDFYVGAEGKGMVTILNGGLISDVGGILGDSDDAFAVLNVDGKDSTWTNSATLTVARFGTGALNVVNGGTVNSTDGYIGKGIDSTGTVLIDGGGSTWTNSGSLTVGHDGTGNLLITKGGAVSNGSATVGKSAGSTGMAFVDGGSTWTNSGDLTVGDAGNGNLAITNGGAVSNDAAYVGKSAGSTGMVFVDGGSTWASVALLVGFAGTGELNILNGGAVSSGLGFVGFDSGSAGTVTVDGGGSTWTNSSNLFVGDQGTGMLNISNGGKVSDITGYVGAFSGSIGTVTVDGGGSAWNNSSDLFVGGFSTGTLTISNSGTVSNGWGYIGYVAGSTGMAAVDGVGSKWTNSGDLYVGGFGTGTLTVSNGGVVSSADLFVGYQGTGALNVVNGGKLTNQAAILGDFDTATATVTVDGAGSSWSTDDDLTVGLAGHATLAISNGGSADADTVGVGQEATATGAVTVDGMDSKWTNKNGLYLGGLGSGTLAVTNGGVASGGLAYLALGAAATAQATVDGKDSLWEMHGDLVIGLNGTASVTLSNDGTALVDFATVIASQAGSTGNLNIGGAAGAAATGAGVLGSATFQFGLGTGALNFNHTNTNYAFDAGISGLGTINQIAGNTNLTGNSSGFTGATNVSGGRLAVNGSLASSLVTITGGMLGGNGTVGGIVAQSGGIIAPGNSIGTLNVAGNVDQAAGSIYAVELTSTGTSDFLHATGAATIDSGALIDVVKLDGAPYVAGTHYTVLQADSGVTGTYTVAGDTGTVFLGLVDSYDANHVYLDVVQKSFASVGLTPNQIAAGAGTESLGSGNPVYDAILQLPSEAAVQDAFDQLSGEIHASAKGMLLEDSRFIRDAATSRISAAFGDAGSTAALPVMAYGEGGPEMVAADTDRFAVWGQAFGSWGNTDSDGNAAAFDRSTGGLLAGADTQLGTWRVGLIGGYSHSSFDADDRNSSGKSDSYHLGLYGGTNWGAIAFRTGAAYSWNSLSTKRAVAFNGFTDGLSADYDAGTAQAFGELAYKADAGHFKVEPFANLAYVSVHTDGFTETGGAAALTSAGSTTDATFTTLGLRASTDLGLGQIKATARGMLGWRHAFGDDTPASSFAFAGGDLFTIAGVPVARDAAVVEAGRDLNMSANATLGLSYTGQFGGGTVDQGAKVNLGLRF
ncbi:autotransporter outer membrane beta-barrel domain-containing protein [Mesorhizobium sp. M1050]|uniref:autotransporter outer membrane beta-barrel domain-containing protein n=1 Tax=Mesorhizobium sp. M1050 TaxID=2957051 RepID=UPI00333A5899